VTPSGGGFIPSFTVNGGAFFMSVANNVLTVTVTTVTQWPAATISWARGFNSLAAVAQATATPAIPLLVGTQTINVRIMAEDQITFRTIVITVRRGQGTKPTANIYHDISETYKTLLLTCLCFRLSLDSSDCSIGGLYPSVSLNVPFNPTTYTYSSSVPPTLVSMTVRAVAAYPTSTMTIDLNGGGFVALTTNVLSSPLLLLAGANVITIQVVSEDTLLSNTYVMNVYRISSVSTMSALTVLPAGGGLMPAIFDSTILSYSVSYPPGTVSFQAVPTSTSNTAVITWALNHAAWSVLPITSGTASPSISIPIGDSLIQLRVMAEDSLTYKLYSIAVHRQSPDPSMAMMRSSLVIAPPFADGLATYSMIVSRTDSYINFIPVPSYPLAVLTFSLNGATAVSAHSNVQTPNFALNNGDNVIVFVCTSEDATVAQTYTFNIHRQSADLQTLLSLVPSGVMTPPVFDPLVLDYAVLLPASQASVVLYSNLDNSFTTQQWNFNNGPWSVTAGASLTTPAVNIPFGDSILAVKVLGEDHTSYAISKLRLHRLSGVAHLASFISTQSFIPNFNSGILVYNLTLPPQQPSVVFSLVLPSAFATVEWSLGYGSTIFTGVTLTPNYPLNTAAGTIPWTMYPGDQVMNIHSVSEDTFTEQFTTVWGHLISDDMTLLRLDWPQQALTPHFSPSVHTYTALLDAGITSFSFSACQNYPLAQVFVTWPGSGTILVACDEVLTLPVLSSDAILEVKVKAEWGNTLSYLLNVHQMSSDATLSSMMAAASTPLSVSPLLFSPTTFAYDVYLSNQDRTYGLMIDTPAKWSIVTWSAFVNSPAVLPIAAVLPQQQWITFNISVGTTLIQFHIVSEDTLYTNVYNLTLHRSPLWVSNQPSYVMSSASWNLIVQQRFENQPWEALSLTAQITAGTITSLATQTLIDGTTVLTFVFNAPPTSQVITASFVVTGANTHQYSEPVSFDIVVVVGSWLSAGLPAIWYTNQNVSLQFAPSSPVFGPIHIQVDGTAAGYAYTNTAVVPTLSTANVSLLVTGPPSAGSFNLAFSTVGYFPLPPLTVSVVAQSPLTITSTVPAVLLIGETLSIVATLPAAGPGGAVMHPRMSTGSVTPASVILQQGVVSSFVLIVTAPAIRTALAQLMFDFTGPDAAHYANPPVSFQIADLCDATVIQCVAAHTLACTSTPTSSGSATYLCTCLFGWTGMNCETLLYTPAPSGSAAALIAPPPAAILTGSQGDVSSCDEFQLDGSTSYGLGLTPSQWTFEWALQICTLDGTFCVASTSAVLSNTQLTFNFASASFPSVSATITLSNVRSLKLLAAPLLQGMEYRFALRVSNVYATSSWTTRSVIIRGADAAHMQPWTPQLSVRFPPGQLRSQGDNVFTAVIKESVCQQLPSDVRVSFQWEVTSVDPITNASIPVQLSGTATTKSAMLLVPPNTFHVGVRYQVQVTALLEIGTDNANGFGGIPIRRRARRLLAITSTTALADAAVQLLPSPIQPRIAGSTIRQRDGTAVIVLDARGSWNPDSPIAERTPAGQLLANASMALSFSWSCQLGADALLLVDGTQPALPVHALPASIDMSAPLLSLPAGTLPPNAWYTFTLSAWSGSNPTPSTTLIQLYVEDGTAHTPVVSTHAPRWLTPNAPALCGATVQSRLSTDIGKLMYSWSVADRNGPVSLVGSIQTNAATLTLPPHSLPNAGDYLVSLQVCEPSGTPCATSSSLLSVSNAPSGGSFTVSPIAGIGLSTPFTLIADAFVDVMGQEPLLYAFAYIDLSVPVSSRLEQFLGPLSPTSVLRNILLPSGKLQLVAYVVNALGASNRVVFGTTIFIDSDTRLLAAPALYATNLTSLHIPAFNTLGKTYSALSYATRAAEIALFLARRDESAALAIRSDVLTQLPLVLSALPSSLLDPLEWQMVYTSFLQLVSMPLPLNSTNLDPTLPWSEIDPLFTLLLESFPISEHVAVNAETSAHDAHSAFVLSSGIVKRDGMLGQMLRALDVMGLALSSGTSDSMHTHPPEYCRHEMNLRSWVGRLLHAYARGTPSAASTSTLSMTGTEGFQLRWARLDVQSLVDSKVAASEWELDTTADVFSNFTFDVTLMHSPVKRSLAQELYVFSTTHTATAFDAYDTNDAPTVDVLSAALPMAYRWCRSVFNVPGSTFYYNTASAVVELDVNWSDRTAQSQGPLSMVSNPLLINGTESSGYLMQFIISLDANLTLMYPMNYPAPQSPPPCSDIDSGMVWPAQVRSSPVCAQWMPQLAQYDTSACITHGLIYNNTHLNCTCSRVAQNTWGNLGGEYSAVYLQEDATVQPCTSAFELALWSVVLLALYFIVFVTLVIVTARWAKRWWKRQSRAVAMRSACFLALIVAFLLIRLASFAIKLIQLGNHDSIGSESPITITVQMAPYVLWPWLGAIAVFEHTSLSVMLQVERTGHVIPAKHSLPSWNHNPFQPLFYFCSLCSLVTVALLVWLNTGSDHIGVSLRSSILGIQTCLTIIMSATCFAAVVPTLRSWIEEADTNSDQEDMKSDNLVRRINKGEIGSESSKLPIPHSPRPTAPSDSPDAPPRLIEETDSKNESGTDNPPLRVSTEENAKGSLSSTHSPSVHALSSPLNGTQVALSEKADRETNVNADPNGSVPTKVRSIPLSPSMHRAERWLRCLLPVLACFLTLSVSMVLLVMMARSSSLLLTNPSLSLPLFILELLLLSSVFMVVSGERWLRVQQRLVAKYRIPGNADLSILAGLSPLTTATAFDEADELAFKLSMRYLQQQQHKRLVVQHNLPTANLPALPPIHVQQTIMHAGGIQLPPGMQMPHDMMSSAVDGRSRLPPLEGAPSQLTVDAALAILEQAEQMRKSRKKKKIPEPVPVSPMPPLELPLHELPPIPQLSDEEDDEPAEPSAPEPDPAMGSDDDHLPNLPGSPVSALKRSITNSVAFRQLGAIIKHHQRFEFREQQLQQSNRRLPPHHRVDSASSVRLGKVADDAYNALKRKSSNLNMTQNISDKFEDEW
jgi:hypothetical protein